MIVLKYVGKGRFLKNIPARDIKEEEADQFEIDKLVESELYERVAKPKSTSSKSKSDDEDVEEKAEESEEETD